MSRISLYLLDEKQKRLLAYSPHDKVLIVIWNVDRRTWIGSVEGYIQPVCSLNAFPVDVSIQMGMNLFERWFNDCFFYTAEIEDVAYSNIDCALKKVANLVFDNKPEEAIICLYDQLSFQEEM